MLLNEYAETRHISQRTAEKLLEREELELELEGHVSANEDGETELDDNAVKAIDDYISFRPNEKVYTGEVSDKPIDKKQKNKIIAIFAAVFAYYMIVFLLNVFGVISKTVMTIMIVPVILGVVILYSIAKKQERKI